MDRRNFLKSLGTLSLAMVPDITNGPIKKLFPLLIPAEEIIPGTPYWYASTCRECPAGCGVLLKVRDGNVIKIEGNPNHPISKGGLCMRGQAALQELYNIDRLRTPVYNPQQGLCTELNWEQAIGEITSKMTGNRTVILAGSLTGSQQNFMRQWMRSIGSETSLIEYEPFNRQSYIKANEIVFNRAVPTEYRFDSADYVLSFGADFMETWQSPVGMSNDFSNVRRFSNGSSAKLVYIGISDSLTAANADEEYKIKPTSEAVVMLALARWLIENDESISINSAEKGEWKRSLNFFTLEKASETSGLPVDVLTRIATQLQTHENTLILCGEPLSAHKRGTDSQIAANILNYIAGNYGKTIFLRMGDERKWKWSANDFENFIISMERGTVDNLLIYNTNPLYTYPDSDRLKAALKQVKFKIALATTINETAAIADYILPVSHTIETWGIEEPRTGVYSLVQPAMEPVFNSKSMEEALLALKPTTRLPQTLSQYINEEWQKIFRLTNKGNSFEDNWKQTLVQGGVWSEQRQETAFPISSRIHAYLRNLRFSEATTGLTLAVNYSSRFFDGRGANKSWLWEVPNSLHHTVWDVPLRIHPELAAKEGLKEGDIVSLSSENRSVEMPVLITSDVFPSVIAVEMGAGHQDYGKSAVKETGNPLQILPTETDALSGDIMLLAKNIQLKKTAKWRKLVRLQGSYDQGEREILQHISFEEAKKLERNFAKRTEPHFPVIYPIHEHKVYDWAMVIDLSACNGCGACAVACYAENNLPVMGKQQCDKGREMAWLRIERFNVGDRPRFIPMMCQQCENAPCETVCPVYATVHSDEGLNVQVYNRCVGTRYCSNNCPYKVRRFNYFLPQWPEPTNRQLNPDIYHRPKGVMEKCTFCVHRIRKAKEDAKIEGRLVNDGEIVPACAQSCPTGAITFGNLNDPQSKVSKLVQNFRAYHVFENLNTQPSVIYLKSIKHD